jgi:thiosulfate dehydrogenase (quinone) large subunit
MALDDSVQTYSFSGRNARMRAAGLTKDRNENVLACLRVGVGVFFLVFGEYKVFGTEFIQGGNFQKWISGFIAHGSYPFMVSMLQNVVLAHGKLFAYLVAYGEFAIGLGLIFGILTRTASIGGLLLMLAMLFSADYPGAGAAFWRYFGASLSHSIFVMCFLAFIFGNADHALALWPRAHSK